MGCKHSCLASPRKVKKKKANGKSFEKQGKISKSTVLDEKDGLKIIEKKDVTVVNAEYSPTKVKPVQEIQFLESAPKSHSLPTAIKYGSKKNEIKITDITIPAQSMVEFTPMLNLLEHTNQPVDPIARKLAQGSAQPKTWKDLHWHLIQARNLSSTEDKVRALFTWLCSIPKMTRMFENNSSKKGDASQTPVSLMNTPESVIEALLDGRATYFQAFHTLCNHSGIKCVVVRGIAKGFEYSVGQNLGSHEMNAEKPLFDKDTNTVHPAAVKHQHSWNAVEIDGSWYLFDPTWAARRLSMAPLESLDEKQCKASEAVAVQYETDMFFYKTDPRKLFFTHFPFEDKWQLLQPVQKLQKFEESVLLKPSFFRYGLGLYSHTEGVIPVMNDLSLKLRLPATEPETLLFTFNLTLDGLGEVYNKQNLPTFGVHTICPKEKMVTFKFRFPKKGLYTLLLYVRKSGESLFADVCEYKIRAMCEGAVGGSGDHRFLTQPFPPCSQSSYGPTEKASEMGLQTVPSDTEPIVKAQNGFFELRFVQSKFDRVLPRITGRLKSLHVSSEQLKDCLIYREIEASKAMTGISSLWTTTGTSVGGACVEVLVISGYLPQPGEYALEVFGKPADSPDEASYHLVWQFLLDSEDSLPMPDFVRIRLSCVNMGAMDAKWSELGLKVHSHYDPFIRIRTVAREGTDDILVKNLSKRDIISRYTNSLHGSSVSNFTKSSNASQITVIEQSQNDADEASGNATLEQVKEEEIGEDSPSKIKPEDHDLLISIQSTNELDPLVIVQMVDISVEEENDVTDHVFRLPKDDSEAEDKLIDAELMQTNSIKKDHTSMKSVNSTFAKALTINYLVRIPVGGHFYKLFFYACEHGSDPNEPIPLVYTYLIEAPSRITSVEQPYIGVLGGPFPQKKIEKRSLINWLHVYKFTKINIVLIFRFVL